LGFVVLCLPACQKGVAPELTAAQDAVAAAKAEGAPDLCADNYSNAELKLKQAQLLFDDNEKEAATEAAVEAKKLAKEALDCALLAKQPKEEKVSGAPAELGNFKTSIYFDFNDDSISSQEAQKLAAAASFLEKFQKDYHFNIIVQTYADPPGSPEANEKVTDLRARTVRFLLVQKGVEESRIVMKPMGETPALPQAASKAKTASKKSKAARDPEMRRADIAVEVLSVAPKGK
jgi:outer membrane protein OmpA-like peptidoglycan-associated protein